MIKIIILFLLSFNLYGEEDCQTLAQAPNFYRETEWLWFKGKSVDLDLEKAKAKAKGMALEKLFDRCEGIPGNAKIFHICHRKLGAAQEVFAIASTYRKDCSTLKYAKEEETGKISNKKLLKEMRDFFKIIDNHKPKNLPCTPEKRENCLKVGTYLFDMARFLDSLVPLEYACEDGVIKACFLGGIGSYILKEENAALTLFRKACKKDDSNACLFLGISLFRFQKFNLSRKKFLKSCYLGNPRGCLFLGILSEERKNENMALKAFYNSCLMDYGEGCRKAYELLHVKGWKMGHPFAHKACQLGDGEVCLYRGLDELAEQKYQTAVKYLNRSCELGIGDGCFNLGLFLGEKYQEKSIIYHKKGCDLGNVSSCLELEQYFKNDEALKITYQMYACQLGIETSCFSWGKHILKDNQVSMGKNILRRSCERGYNEACTYLKSL
ncbi:MAG: sel1 repeat family protein [Deltaproteobacteria bacterium]|nr:MAG: sel1 repeat family protein [Deltaproteobacteria bacterium]